MSANIIAAFFIVSLLAPVLAVLGGVVFVAWTARRAARTAMRQAIVPTHI